MANLNDFPYFTPISAAHLQAFSAYFRNNPAEISEFAFAEMFAWRAVRNTSVAMLDGGICVLLEKNGKWCFYPPFGAADNVAAISKMARYLKDEKGDGYIYGLTEQEAVGAAAADGSLEYAEDTDNADYVYAASDLISLAGRKYDGKRNHLNRFMENYSHTFEPITPEILPQVKDFQEKWCQARSCADDLSLANEGRAVMEVLDNYGVLPVTGAALVVDGVVQAFSIASELNPEMAVVLFEKANPEFKGIYQAINNLFCSRMLSKYKWINREQDGGAEGLRRAKQSYYPVRMIRKFNLKLKKL
ncbi:MAG: phosphatidylglycerol lysyltransferase domain-containing protein [Spirochaetia bacterium]|nr:phosphatidylglycerol lysyltransferase domain-containing protein [Spirochaetia bacterium]